MPNIDIQVAPELAKLFELPPCTELSLPPPAPLKVKLPTGGFMQAFADVSKGIPNDCSMTFSLMLQIAPFLAVSECLMKILKFLSSLKKVVESLQKPFELGPAIQEFLIEVKDVADCLALPTPLNIVPFIRDLLCLILRVLNCFLSQMKPILSLLEGLQIQLDLAQSTGNFEQIAMIQCAHANASTQAQHLMASLEPVGVLLELAGTMFEIAQVPAIKLPAFGSQTDLDSLNALVKSVQDVVAVITIATEALGGCGDS